jgi:hypothetical protein
MHSSIFRLLWIALVGRGGLTFLPVPISLPEKILQKFSQGVFLKLIGYQNFYL